MDIETTFPYVLAAAMYVSFTFAIVSNSVHSRAICCYVNGILRYPRNFPELVTASFKPRLPMMSIFGLLFAYIVSVTDVFLPVGSVYFLHWGKPSTPTIIFSGLLPECYFPDRKLGWALSSLEMAWKLVIFLVNHWTFSFGLHAAAMTAFGTGVMAAVTIAEYLKM